MIAIHLAWSDDGEDWASSCVESVDNAWHVVSAVRVLSPIIVVILLTWMDDRWYFI